MEKLAKRFYGPFTVLERIGATTYRLQLPEGTRIHSVFHSSLLKPFSGPPSQPECPSLPNQFVEGQPVITPLAILSRREIPGSAPVAWEVLVQWHGLSPDETSWEDWRQLCQEYHLEDKVDFQGVKDVTSKPRMPKTQEAPASMV